MNVSYNEAHLMDCYCELVSITLPSSNVAQKDYPKAVNKRGKQIVNRRKGLQIVIMITSEHRLWGRYHIQGSTNHQLIILSFRLFIHCIFDRISRASLNLSSGVVYILNRNTAKYKCACDYKF